MTPPPSGIACLARIGRFHALDLSAERLTHDWASAGDEPTDAQLIRMARTAGLRAKVATLAWDDLATLGTALPAIARLRNGASIILSGFRTDRGKPEVVLSDPLAETQGFLFLDQATFEAEWQGRVLLLKRDFGVADPDRPFGIGWFIPEFLRQKRFFRDIGIAALLLNLLMLATPIYLQIVIDKVLVHQSYSTLYVLSGGIAIALVFDAVFTFLRRYLLLFATNRIDIRVATRTFTHLASLPIDFFDRAPAGVLVQHMQQASKVREFLTGRLFLTGLDATALLVFAPILVLYSPGLSFTVLLFTLLIGGVITALIGPFRRRLRRLYLAEGERQAFLVETIHGMRTVKSLALEARQRREWENRSAQAVTMHFEVGKISATAQSVTGLLEKLMLVAIIGFGAQSVFDGTLTVGALIAFQMLAGRVSGPLVQLVSLIHEYQETALSIGMLGTIMNAKPEQGATGRGLRMPIKGAVDFDGVTFRYGSTQGGTTPPALDDVSFQIPEGSIFGIMGRSGSGKTTITRLLQGLHSAEAGIVRLDGYDLREIDLVHLRTHIGVVLQDDFLFRGTVRENIAAARPSATLQEVAEAARLAGAEEFIERLPQGFETRIDEGAANLSGGQRQRLAIARALLTKPRILILDEATSALDAESEAIVQTNLRHIAEGRTLIIVSHRLSSLVDADRILVLDRGRVVDSGGHKELLGRCTIYRGLWQQQNRHLG
ncbi:MAG TPA: peptidase domain-containing ABC transporter [Stellaceae bacterium]|nr:peptidase domain-containing ABC transporter [Stellaceae bacterium]